MEYIITKKNALYGECLFSIAGKSLEKAEKRLREVQEQNPGEEFAIREVEDKDCWWNDPFLVN